MLVLCSSSHHMQSQTCARHIVMGKVIQLHGKREELKIVSKCDLGLIKFSDSSCLNMNPHCSLTQVPLSSHCTFISVFFQLYTPPL